MRNTRFVKNALRHNLEVSGLERAALKRMYELIPDNGANQTPEARLEALKTIDPDQDVAIYDVTLGKYPSTAPRPFHVLTKMAFKQIKNGNNVDQVSQFLTDTLLPMARLGNLGAAHEAKIVNTPGRSMCRNAEQYYSDAVNQINTSRAGTQSWVGIYHDTDGMPLAFRKKWESSSAMTLTALSDGTTIVPAGTIVGIPDSSGKKTGTDYKTHPFEVEAFEVTGALDVVPLRLAAWAHPEALDRASFAIVDYGEGYDKNRGDLITDLSLDSFRQAAGQVLALCGVS